MNRKTLVTSSIVLIGLTSLFIFYLGWKALKGPSTPSNPLTTGGEVVGIGLVALGASDPEVENYNQSLVNNLSPDKSQEAFVQEENGEIFLKIVDIKTKKIKLSEKVNLEDVEVVWIKPSEVFLVSKPSALIPTSAWSFNLKNKGLKYIFKNEPGLMLNWSGNGDYVLKFNERLSLVNNKSGQKINLPFLTMPSKCVFDEEVIYCAIPKTIPSNVVLPDDYLKHKFYSDDRILKITLNPTKTEILFNSPNIKIDALNLRLINQGLYFINRYDDKIYKLLL